MRRFYEIIAVALVLTVLVVWFVPGAADWVEATMQTLVGNAAR